MSPVPASPKISVLLPCYRQEAFVREAVESVLSQNFGDWEIVASDDASPDKTYEVLEDVARRDGRIRIFRQKRNLGMVANWNFCLRQARGEAVKLMGGDDLLARQDCLSRQWQTLQESGAALVACARTVIDESSGAVTTLRNLPTGIYSVPGILPQFLMHPDNLIGEPVCCLFPRANANRGFNLRYRQNTDIEMWLHLLDQGSLAYDAEPLAAFRTHRDQASTTNWQSGLALEEHRVLMLERALSPGLSARVKFHVLQQGKEALRHTDSEKIRTAIDRLAREIGPTAMFRQDFYHSVARTFARWSRSLRKRVSLSQP